MDFEISQNNLLQILQGVILAGPTRWPGMRKVVAVSKPSGPGTPGFISLSQESLGGTACQDALQGLAEQLEAIPGCMRIENARRADENGIYVPASAYLTGQAPGTLLEYAMDPTEQAPSGLKLKMHQRRAVMFLRNITKERAGAILGADPGTGKTVAALQALWLDGYLHRPGLIIGPLGAKATWVGQDSDPFKHYGLNIYPLEGATPSAEPFNNGARWYFIHYDILPAWQSFIFMLLKPSSIVLDESHYCMNPDSDRTKSVIAVTTCASVDRRYGLTGTPIPKTRMDLLGQLLAIQPGQWGSRVPFGIRYCNGHREAIEGSDQSFWVFDGQSNTSELRMRLAGTYLRYTKADVPNELPKLTRKRIDVELPPSIWKEYRQAQNDIVAYRQSKGQGPQPKSIVINGQTFDLPTERQNAAALVTTSTLKSILAKGKLPQAVSTVIDLLSKHRKIVVFTWKIDSAKYLTDALDDLQADHMMDVSVAIYGPIDGTDAWDKRQAMAKDFATAQGQAVLVATRGSMGIAINALSVADACLQTMPDWNPDGNIQAESRLHREGNQSVEVCSYYMLAKNTLDDRVLELIEKKGQEAHAMSTIDMGGLHLAADLDPSLADDQWSLDEICNLLNQMED